MTDNPLLYLALSWSYSLLNKLYFRSRLFFTHLDWTVFFTVLSSVCPCSFSILRIFLNLLLVLSVTSRHLSGFGSSADVERTTTYFPSCGVGRAAAGPWAGISLKLGGGSLTAAFGKLTGFTASGQRGQNVARTRELESRTRRTLLPGRENPSRQTSPGFFKNTRCIFLSL